MPVSLSFLPIGPTCLLIGLLGSTGMLHAVPDDSRYSVEVLQEAMPQPMEFEFLPDGRILWIEIGGKVKILDPRTKVVKEAATLDVWTDQECGLLGMALDPGFAQNHWVYLHWSPKDFSGSQICRYVLNGDKLDLSSGKTLLRYEEQRRECCHHAGCMEFGPDGNLYISTGDNTYPPGDSANYTPIDERPDHFPRDAQKSASNPNDLRGKIIRIQPKPDGTYAIPSGNLFPPGTSGTRPEIFVMGCRNPWRFSIDEKTGFVYWGEVGPDAHGDGPRGPRGYDEINQARKAGNFGWPYFIANNLPYTPWDFATNKARDFKWDPLKPVNLSPNNTGAKELPPAQEAFIYWPYGQSDKWPELGSGGRTACAGPVFHHRKSFEKSDGMPADYDRCLLFFDWERRFIKWAHLDADSRLVKIEPFTPAVSIRRCVQARFADDGSLYLMDYGSTWGANKDSKLVRVTYQSGNRAPKAIATADRSSGAVPLALKLSSEGSVDPDGDALRYEWKLTPGNKVLSTEANPSVELATPGDVTISLTVTDPHGATSRKNLEVHAGNTAPEVVIVEPRPGTLYTPGKPVKFQIKVTDAEDGSSTSAAAAFAARTLVTVSPDLGGAQHPALGLVKQSDCFNCHMVEQKLIGPSFVEVADKYRGQAGAAEVTMDRIAKGSQGVWGAVPMLPHPDIKGDDLQQIVTWIYSLKAGESAPVATRGIEGEIPAPSSPSARGFVLDAGYTDNGNAPANPLSGRASITLRSRKQEGESADEIHGPTTIAGGTASGQRFMGAINHGHWIKFSGLNLAGTNRLLWRVASGGSGGTIELRSGKPDGPLLASLAVPNNGGWEKWEEKATPLQKRPDGIADVFVVFTNPGHSALMNLDSIEFLE